MKPRTLNHIQEFFQRYPQLKYLEPQFYEALNLLILTAQQKSVIFLCGNGGSAADAEHIHAELMKGFLLKRPLSSEKQNKIKFLFPNENLCLINNLQEGIKSISLVSSISLSTAFANDVDPQLIFAQQFINLASKGDILFAISTSGNSKNIIHALKIAKALGNKSIGLTGKSGGEMAQLLDVELRIPPLSTMHTQELHLPLYHTLCATLESEMFEE